VFTQALPSCGLAPGEMPDLLERYGASFDPQTGTTAALKYGCQ
jgi:hypothetical protein